ncbi:hypothetical protein [Streptococcus hyointestinalis]|uniref:hypothetical protein n=1 Tax=Streptococcus hyointestinalis TaxID=1337 RepID=UPI0013DEE96D|nr:hypothetical protein [Streptococcus hyointestinalis]
MIDMVSFYNKKLLLKVLKKSNPRTFVTIYHSPEAKEVILVKSTRRKDVAFSFKLNMIANATLEDNVSEGDFIIYAGEIVHPMYDYLLECIKVAKHIQKWEVAQ